LTVTAATAKTFVVTPRVASIPVTGTVTYTAIETFSDGTSFDRTVSSVWTSGSTNATVAAGTSVVTGAIANAVPVLITATYTVGGVAKTATAALTVNAATSQSFVVTPATASIPVTGNQKFTAIETFSDGTTLDRTAATVWTSGNANATVAAGTSVATGVTANVIPVVITATYTVGAVVKTATAALTVTAATSASFKVAPATASIPVGGTLQYTAIETFSDGTTQDRTAASVWTSGNANAAVAAGTSTVTGVTANVTPVVITATYTVGAVVQTATSALTVTAAASKGFTVTPVAASVVVGANQQFAAMETFTDGTIINRTAASVWTSGNANATVLNTGVATGVTANATPVVITATYTAGGITKTATAALTVTAAPPAPAINLRSVATFGIAARAGLTSTGVTTVNGDIALFPLATCTDSTGGPGSASRSCLVQPLYPADGSLTGMTVNSGSIYWAADTFDNGATANSAGYDLNLAWLQGKAKVDTLAPNGGAGTLGGQLGAAPSAGPGKIILPGVYSEAAALNFCAGCSATFSGTSTDVWIIKVGSSFTSSGTQLNPSKIYLTGGALAKNIWFIVQSDVVLGAGTIWSGNLLAGNSVTINAGSIVTGRMLAGADTSIATGAFVFTATTGPITITVPAP
jgi:predicted heme/steroid binding protein